MSIIAVHGPYTMAVSKQADADPAGPLAEYVDLNTTTLAITWGGTGVAPSNVAELRDYVSGDIYLDTLEDDSTWVGIDGGGAGVTLATGRTYYWDDTEWVEDADGAPAA